MPTIKLGGGPGGTVQGNYGTYQPGTDGFYTVDVRDVPQLLAGGLTFLRNGGEFYTTAISPRAATAGRIVASGALTSGGLTISNQPDVPRQLNVVVANSGSPSIGTGTVALTYKAADNATYTDTFQLGLVAQTETHTFGTSRPVTHLNTGIVSSPGAGSSPIIRIDDTNVLGLPSDPGAQDFTVAYETDGGTLMTSPGTPSVTCIGGVAPVNTPTGSSAISFQYGFVSPLI